MKDEKGRIPSYQWYPADWRSDPGVQALSFHERGVWREMIDFMHESPQRGRLMLNGKAMPVDALARALGLMKQDLELVLAKLLEYGVASQDKKGIYCRRMVRDEQARLAHKNAGKLGGNPNFKKGQKNPYYTAESKDNPTLPTHKRKITKEITKISDGKDNLTHKQKITPSSAFASSSSRPSLNTLVVSGETTAAKIPDKIPFEELRTAYNERRGALPEARGLTDGRKKKLRSRWVEHPDIDFWKSVFVKAGKSETMLKWASFDWIMKSEDNYTKTLEGNYDNDRELKTVPRPKATPMPRERMPTPEEEAELAREAPKVFGEFRRKKFGTFVGPVEPVTKTVEAEELPV